MARLNTVKSARKPQGACGKCGKPIGAGEPYKWVKPRYGGKRIRCAACPAWKPSELSSSKLTTVWAAQESFAEGNYETAADMAEAMRAVAEAANEVAQEYRDSAENIESGFGHEVPMSEELSQKAEDLESWAGEVESAADEVEELGDGECSQCSEGKEDHCEGFDAPEAWHEFADAPALAPVPESAPAENPYDGSASSAPSSPPQDAEDDDRCAECGKAESEPEHDEDPDCRHCGSKEDDHHEFESNWREQADDHAGVVDECPV